jgi:hypothetical protein
MFKNAFNFNRELMDQLSVKGISASTLWTNNQNADKLCEK